jgi:CBS domain-containing protein
MLANSLITNGIVPLKTSETGEEALGLMSELNLSHYPIVNNEQLLGLISDEDIIGNNIEEPIGSYSLSLSKAFVRNNDHLYEVLRLLGESKLTIIPVVDDEDKYLGIITQNDLLNYFADSGSFTEAGSILVLEVPKRDYSMAEISQIVESEDGVILSSFITTNLDESVVDVTLKINKHQIQPIIANFERYSYKVKFTMQEDEIFDAAKERYDSLMSYLNV